MIIKTVRIDGVSYALARDEDASAVLSGAAAAVQQGAGTVEFRAAGGRAVTALITVGTSLTIETIEIPDQPEDEDEPQLPSDLGFVDFDEYN